MNAQKDVGIKRDADVDAMNTDAGATVGVNEGTFLSMHRCRCIYTQMQT